MGRKMLLFLGRRGARCEKKSRTLRRGPVVAVKIGYGTVTVNCVLWAVLPETAVMVKV
jgi:hypothetical protein